MQYNRRVEMDNPSDNSATDGDHNSSANGSMANTQWQLKALTEALGDLSLNVVDSLSVGRGSDNDVVLGSKQISRNHALLSVLNGQLYLKDLASSNGTFVNDEQIEANKSKQLNADDKVSFASFSFAVVKDKAGALVTDTAPVSATDTDTHTNNDATTDPQDMSAKLGSGESSLTTNNNSTDNSNANGSATDLNLASDASTPSKTTSQDPLMSEPEALESVLPPMPLEALSSANVESALSHDSAADGSGRDSTEAMMQQPVQPLQANLETSAASSDDALSLAAETPESVSPAAPAVAETISSERQQAQATAIGSAPAASVDQPTLTTSEPSQENIMTNKETATTDSSSKDPHDKTTTTELQQEADPDVLRAKQAATSQLSGTANLGGDKDLGTAGNNAMDQALNNSATNADIHKKPSGGWFIWVFIGLIILGIALWMFNMGGVGANV